MSMELATPPNTPAQPVILTPLVRLLRFCARWIDWIVAIVLVISSAPVGFVISGAPLVLPHPNFADDSWMVDIVYKATSGTWLGRDVVFTYGILYQWIIAVPSRVVGFSLGTARQLPENVLLALTIIITFGISKLLLSSAPAWKRALFLILAVGFFGTYWTFIARTSAELSTFAIFLVCVDHVLKGKMRVGVASSLMAIASISAFMLSADTGIYSVLAFLIVLGTFTILAWNSRNQLLLVLKIGIASTTCFAALAVLVNTLLNRRPFAFQFLRDAFAIVSTYRWIETTPIAKQDAWFAACVAAVGFLTMLLAWHWRDNTSTALTRRSSFLLSAPVFAFAMLQTGLVRADWYHISVALYPIIVFVLMILLGSGPLRPTPSILLPLLAIAGSSVLAGPSGLLNLRVMVQNYQIARSTNCPSEEFSYLDRTCFGLPQGEIIKRTTPYLQEHTQPKDLLLIYPYENEFGDAARRQVAGGVLQNYLVGGQYLIRRQLQGLEKQRPAYGLYFVDNKMVWQIDGISNFSRTPEVWLYMQSHYRAQDEIISGVFAIVRDDSRAARIYQKASSLPRLRGSSRVTHDAETIDIGAVDWPEGADFLKLKMTVGYPVTWKLRKASELSMFLQLADGSVKQVNLVIPPNVPTEVWLYPWEETDLSTFLSFSELDWHTGKRPPVTRVQLYIKRHDWYSQLPTSVTVQEADAVRLEMN